MTEPASSFEALYRLAVRAAALSRRARRLGQRFHVTRPIEAENTKAPAATGARKGTEE